MLGELLRALLEAKTEKEKGKAYYDLQMVGVDKFTADVLVKELGKEW